MSIHEPQCPSRTISRAWRPASSQATQNRAGACYATASWSLTRAGCSCSTATPKRRIRGPSTRSRHDAATVDFGGIMEDGAGPLTGSRIIELADVALGQPAVMIPADLGADVMPEGSPGRTAAGPTGCLEPDERQASGSSAGSRIAKDLRPTLYPPAAWTCRTRTAVLTQPQEPVSHRPPFFTEELLLRRSAAARVGGFGAAGFWWPCAAPVPSDREVDAFVASVEEAGVGLVGLVGLNFFAGDLADPDCGVLSIPGRSGQFRDMSTRAPRTSWRRRASGWWRRPWPGSAARC